MRSPDSARLRLQFGGVGAFFAQSCRLRARRYSVRRASCSVSVIAARRRAIELAELLDGQRLVRAWTVAARSRPDWRETPPDHAYRRMLTGGSGRCARRARSRLSERSGLAGACASMSGGCAAELLLFGFDGDRLKIFGFEDLPAIEALHVVHAISAGEDNCFLMLAGGLHSERLEDTNYCNESGWCQCQGRRNGNPVH